MNSFCTAKESNKMKRQITEWKTITDLMRLFKYHYEVIKFKVFNVLYYSAVIVLCLGKPLEFGSCVILS